MAISMLRTPISAAFVLFVLFLLNSKLSFAQDSEIESLRSLVKGMEQQLQKALQRIDQLEKERASASVRVDQVEKSMNATRSAPSSLNPAIGMAIDATGEHRSKAGGTFNFRSAEIGISATIDPYARGYAFFTGSGEGVEVEEAAIFRRLWPFG